MESRRYFRPTRQRESRR